MKYYRKPSFTFGRIETGFKLFILRTFILEKIFFLMSNLIEVGGMYLLTKFKKHMTA